MSGLSRASLCLESSSSREPSAQLKSSASNTRNKACHKPQQKVITMNVSGGNSKEIFELFTNKQGRRPRMLNAGAEGVLDQ